MRSTAMATTSDPVDDKNVYALDTISPAVLGADVQADDIGDVYHQRELKIGVTEERTEEDILAEKKLVRKIDRYIVPLLFLCYGVQYLDKIGIASGVAFGLKKDLHLVGQDYSWLSTGFYIAYLLAEFPSNWLMQRYPIDRVLAICVAIWGVNLFVTAACKNFTQIMALRVILGISEAAVLPGFYIMTTAWYRKSEQHLRAQLWITATPISALCTLMIFYALGKNSETIAGWKSISLFLGALSVILSIFVWFYLATPLNARWLTPEERSRAHARLIGNQQGDSESGQGVNWSEVKETFCDPMVWWSEGFTLLYSLSNGGTTVFASLILQSFGLSAANSIAYQMPEKTIQLIGVLLSMYFGHKYQHKNINLLMCVLGCIPAIIGIFLQALLDNNHRWGRIAGFWFMGFFNLTIYIVWAQNGINCAGRTKKSAFQALTFATFSVGSMAGPQAFRDQDAPSYRPGLYFCAACYALMCVLAVCWRFFVMRENRRRDRVVAEMGLSPQEWELQGRLNALKGMTDRQNIHFRYRC